MQDDSVICLQSSAFYALLDSVLDRVDERFSLPKEKRWIDTDEAMDLLGIRSKTTLLQLRNEGRIRYSQPQHKVILYDRNSIAAYIDKHARETF